MAKVGRPVGGQVGRAGAATHLLGELVRFDRPGFVGIRFEECAAAGVVEVARHVGNGAPVELEGLAVGREPRRLAGDADPRCAEAASVFTPVPGGIGPIQSGDKLEVRIQGLTPLVNQVK